MCQTQKWNGGKGDRIVRDKEEGRRKKSTLSKKRATRERFKENQ